MKIVHKPTYVQKVMRMEINGPETLFRINLFQINI